MSYVKIVNNVAVNCSSMMNSASNGRQSQVSFQPQVTGLDQSKSKHDIAHQLNNNDKCPAISSQRVSADGSKQDTVYRNRFMQCIAASPKTQGNIALVERRNSDEYCKQLGRTQADASKHAIARCKEQDDAPAQTKSIKQLASYQNNFRQDYIYTHRNRRQRRGSHSFQASRKIEIQEQKDQYNHKLPQRLIEDTYEKKAFQKISNSDSQSYTDENREDISIDQSSDCDSYSKQSQLSPSNQFKKNDSDASSSNSSSFKSSNKTCSEKIFMPSFKFVADTKDVDMDQKSQSSSSDESVKLSVKNKACRDLKNQAPTNGKKRQFQSLKKDCDLTGEAEQVILSQSSSNVKACKVSNGQIETIANVTAESRATNQSVGSNNSQFRQSLMSGEVSQKQIESLEESRYQECNTEQSNKRNQKIAKKIIEKPTVIGINKRRSHNEKLYQRNAVDRVVVDRVDRPRDVDRQKNYMQDVPYYQQYPYSLDGQFPIQSPELLMNFNAIRIKESKNAIPKQQKAFAPGSTAPIPPPLPVSLSLRGLRPEKNEPIENHNSNNNHGNHHEHHGHHHGHHHHGHQANQGAAMESEMKKEADSCCCCWQQNKSSSWHPSNKPRPCTTTTTFSPPFTGKQFTSSDFRATSSSRFSSSNSSSRQAKRCIDNNQLELSNKFASGKEAISSIMSSSNERSCCQPNEIADNQCDLDMQLGSSTDERTHQAAGLKTSLADKACSRVSSKQAYFQDILEKSKNLAKIFKGVVKTENQFSICKGQFSIRFNCQNEHNFFLPAEKIKNLDLEQIKTKYRNSRLELQTIFQDSQKESKFEENKCEKACHTDTCSPVVNVDFDASSWCVRCLDYYNHCLDTYNSQLLELVGGLFTKQIMYRCRAVGHKFYVSSLRKQKFQKQYRIQDYTCPECKKIQKENERKAAAEQEQQERKLLAEAQRKLFEKAKRIEMQQESHFGHVPQSQFSQQRYDERKDLRQQERALNEQAKKLSHDFLNQQKGSTNQCNQQQPSGAAYQRAGSQSETGPSGWTDANAPKLASYDQVYLTYKFLLTPLSLLVKGMAKKTEQDVKKYYHKIAIQLHPDKNCHPQAKEAFQKIQEAVSEANTLRKTQNLQECRMSGSAWASHSAYEQQQPTSHNFGCY